MSSVIPSTGTNITMGRTRNAYNLAGTVSLSATLGPQIGKSAGQNISLSASFGGKTAPGTY